MLDARSDRVTYNYGLTINLGNFESAKIDFGMSTDVLPDETPEQALLRCRKVVNRAIKKREQQIAEERGSKD